MSATVSISTRALPVPLPRRLPSGLLWAAAALAILLCGMAAEWLDFRALRVPLLMLAGCGVLAAAWAVTRGRAGVRPFLAVVVTGAASWAVIEATYVVIHLARGELFHAANLGPQWSQAILLMAVHGAFIGVPTGLAVALVLHAAARVRRGKRSAVSDQLSAAAH